MLNLLVCFLSLHLCIPVDIAPTPGVLSPQVYHGTLFEEDPSIGIHSCYEGRYLWNTQVGQLVIFNNRLYQVGMVGVFPENTDAGEGWDLFIFTCYSPEWERVCFHIRDFVWDRFIIGLTDITELFVIHP